MKNRLLLTSTEVADLTGLSESFWIFVAENESEWNTRRFTHVGGHWRITESCLEKYLHDVDLGIYYDVYEDCCLTENAALLRHSGNPEHMDVKISGSVN